MTSEHLEWMTTLPTQEGEYLVDDGNSEPRRVTIVNMKIDNNPERPDNFHVVEMNEDYYALSEENGCDEWSWALITDSRT
ncbi:hypothetical protein [Vibrio sp. Hal054]|uniref:hypothetical protein n=1 Tax=Vibrio sp. Hal054 TaxID=3035158 RepID=UPI00301DF0FA